MAKSGFNSATELSQLKEVLNLAIEKKNQLLQLKHDRLVTLDNLKKENLRLRDELSGSEEDIAGSTLLQARKTFAALVQAIDEATIKINELNQLKATLSSTSDNHTYLLERTHALTQRPFTADYYVEKASSGDSNELAHVQSQWQTTEEEIDELIYQTEHQLTEIDRITQHNKNLRSAIKKDIYAVQRLDPTTIHRRGDIEKLQQQGTMLGEQLQQVTAQCMALEDEVNRIKELNNTNRRLDAQVRRLVLENSFASFYNEFTAMFADTNSSGIKRIMHTMQELKHKNYNDADKFIQCGQLMKQIAGERKDRKQSKQTLFGKGRTIPAQAFYDTVTGATFVEHFKNYSSDFLEKIRMDTMRQRHKDWQQCPAMPFEEFCQQFIDRFQQSNSSGIQSIIARMHSLNPSQHDHYNYSEICQLMHTIAIKRADRFLSRSIFGSPGRSEEAQAFYTAAKHAVQNLPDYVNSLLPLLNSVTPAQSGIHR